jgi:hypothetical protein
VNGKSATERDARPFEQVWRLSFAT